jgi:hypothetical protein
MVRRIGKETLRAEAIEELVQPVFEEAMTEADVEPYGQPKPGKHRAGTAGAYLQSAPAARSDVGRLSRAAQGD